MLRVDTDAIFSAIIRRETTFCQVREDKILILLNYNNKLKYWDRHAFANSIDPDQTQHNAVSNQGLHCLPYIKHYFRHING